MTKTIFPIGDNIIIFPLPTESYQTEAGIVFNDPEIAHGKVMAVSQEYKDVYKEGDIVIYSSNAGVSQYYKNKNCLWVNPLGVPKGHIRGIISEDNE